ncbi:hypothetical protein LTR66_015127 [Elasticomyces elasticus]|nr:hypothetical protein LTR66_015127 [Elasticomyces elasticus]
MADQTAGTAGEGDVAASKSGQTSNSVQKPKAQKAAQKKTDAPKQGAGKKKMEGAALIGIDVAKEDDFSEWYQQVILKGGMIEFSDVPGCYIFLEETMNIWENIRTFFTTRIAAMGVKSCYFPMFITEDALNREKEHLEGFAAEVAWVDRGGKTKLQKPLAIRPTSETAMYDYYSKRIRSHRDLPLKLNQWNNVVRWEFKHPQPFLRSREFLWQEGHTAHLRKAQAEEEVMQILDHYAAIYEDLLAVPMVKGRKTKNEQFAGADYTTTVEGFIPATGRGIQGGTSHCLGQNFAKMFNIVVEDPDAERKEGQQSEKVHVWQNSWGFTTRSIGVMVMIHSDNKGLVLPPRISETQVIIVPVGITAKTTPEAEKQLYKEIDALVEVLKDAQVWGERVRVQVDDGKESPGYKFNKWELKGCPLRLEFGPKDSEKHQVTYSRRDKPGEKGTIQISELEAQIPEILQTVQKELLAKASEEYASHRKTITSWSEFVPALNAKNVCIIPHCLEGDCEDQIKELSKGNVEGQEVDEKAPSMGAKSLCIPFEQDVYKGLTVGETKCLNPQCEKKAEKWVMFGRSY